MPFAKRTNDTDLHFVCWGCGGVIYSQVSWAMVKTHEKATKQMKKPFHGSCTRQMGDLPQGGQSAKNTRKA